MIPTDKQIEDELLKIISECPGMRPGWYRAELSSYLKPSIGLVLAYSLAEKWIKILFKDECCVKKGCVYEPVSPGTFCLGCMQEGEYK